MPTIVPDQSFIGKGVVYIGPYDASAGMRDVGNVTALSLEVSEDEKKIMDYSQGGGGTRNSMRRISAVSFKATLTDFNADNWALAMSGLQNAYASENKTVTPFSLKAWHGSLTRIPGKTPTAVVVKDATESTTYTLGTDYKVTDAGIVALSGGSIGDGDTVKIFCHTGAATRIEGYNNTGQVLKAVFEGLNEAQSGSPVIIDFWRLRLGAGANLAMIADDYGNIELTGELLQDSTITGNGLSQYVRVSY
jgi:hypothetical protein